MAVSLGRHDSSTRGENFAGDANLHVRVSLQVLQPVRGMVLGNHIETAFVLGEPDLDLMGTAALAASRGEIEVLFAGETTGL